jgi:hypothetical protein
MVFVQDFQVVEDPYEEVLSQLRRDPAGLLGDALGAAQREGERLRARVGPRSWPAVLAKTVEVHVGPLRPVADGTVLSFGWASRGAASLFPMLDADLEVAPLGSGETQVTLRARYEPPGGALGRRADELLLHRVAESTLRVFLSRLCEGLERGGSAPGARSARAV